MTPACDVELTDSGATVTFKALSNAARLWLMSHAQRGYFPATGLMVSAAEARPILRVLCDAGFCVVVL